MFHLSILITAFALPRMNRGHLPPNASLLRLRRSGLAKLSSPVSHPETLRQFSLRTSTGGRPPVQAALEWPGEGLTFPIFSGRAAMANCRLEAHEFGRE